MPLPASHASSPPYTLYVYSPHPRSHPTLPVLDPAGLYAASLIRSLSPASSSSSDAGSPSFASSSSSTNAPLPFNIKAPSVYWHPTLPRLERNDTTGRAGFDSVCVAEGVKGVQTFISHRVSLSTKEKRVVREEGQNLEWELKPLEAHLATLVEPLVYSVFFPPILSGGSANTSGSTSHGAKVAQSIFDSITYPAYSQGLPFPLSRAIPHRLRQRIQSQAVASARVFEELGNGSSPHPDHNRIGSTDPETERRRKEMKSFAFGGSKGILGFAAGDKEEWREEFWRQRMTSLGKEILSPLLSFIPSADEVTSGSSLPRPLIHLYALLAPLLLFSPTLQEPSPSFPSGKTNPLAAHPLVRLLTDEAEYVDLRRFVKQAHVAIWGDEEHLVTQDQSLIGRLESGPADTVYGDWKGWKALFETSQEEETKGTEAEAAAAAAVRDIDVPPSANASSTSRWSSYLPWFLRSSTSSHPRGETSTMDQQGQTLSPSQQAALRRLRIGRAFWIATALFGTVGWLFASGILQISITYDDDDEEEEREGGEEVKSTAEEQDEEEGAEEWMFARRAGGLPYVDDEDDEEDDEDEGSEGMTFEDEDDD